MDKFYVRALGACLMCIGVVVPALAAEEATPAVPPAATGNAAPWTLGSAVRRALEVVPELRSAAAGVDASEAAVERDSAFPNPTVEGQIDQKLGLDDGAGGTDISQVGISQPLPLGRLSRQRQQAQARVDAARAELQYRRLLIENQAARAYHRLQLAAARRQVASDRAEAAARYSDPAGSGGGLVRYVSALDRSRLAILRENARFELSAADGDWREAAAGFRQLLALPGTELPTSASFQTLSPPAALGALEPGLDAHPAIRISQHEISAAQAGIAVARSSRVSDPVLTVFRERDVFASGRDDSWGVALGVQIPLWNLNRGPEDVATATLAQVQADAQARRRDLDTALRASHLRLVRLVDQAESYSERILEPSRRFLKLTGRSFAAGEVGVLALLDANNNFFDAKQQHLGLVADAALAAADLRLAAGESLLKGSQP